MGLTVKIVILAAVMAVLPSDAAAQRRAPAADSAAVGGDVGLFLPADDQLSKSATLEGFYEYYMAPRTSIRLGLGWTNPEFDRDPNLSIRHLRIAVDGVYNWEKGAIHPFAGGGLGIYFLQPRAGDANVGDSESKLGGTVFGGVELFATRTLAVKGEARYHLIRNAGDLDPDGLALTVGLKKYF